MALTGGAAPTVVPARTRPAGLIVLAVCGAACVMFMTITDVLSTLPRIGADLRLDQTELQWVADCYPLVLATLLLPAGVLADRFGRRRFLLIGMALLALGTFAVSRAHGPAVAIGGMCLAGVGAGVSFPSTLATITGALPEERRNVGVSIWAAAVPMGGLVGAVLAGIVVDLASWSTVFLVTAIIAAVFWCLALAVVPETRDPAHAVLDVPGAALSAGAVACLVIALTRAPDSGWLAVSTLALFVASVIFLIAFVSRERRAATPLLDVGLFGVPAFGLAVAAMLLMFGGLYAMVFSAYQWEEYVLGRSVLGAGLGLAPLAIPMLPLALAGTTLAGRFGRKRVLSAALAFGAVGAAALATAGIVGRGWPLVLGDLIFGACIGLSAGPGTDAISSAVPAARQGVGSAVNDLARELGATLGIAIAGTAFNTGYRARIADLLDPRSDPVAAALRNSPATAATLLAHAHGHVARYADAVTSGVDTGWIVSLLTVAVAFAIGLVCFARWYPAGAVRADGASASPPPPVPRAA